jgi:predicted nuclease of predicted toxin-antitoxin system
MAARGTKSRKRSDASSHSKQPRDLVFFVDKCLGLKTVPDALRAIGENVELKTDHFDQDADDATWVTEVGARGWIILSADKNLRHNHIEIVALLKSNTHSFLLTSGNYSGREMAHAFVAAMPQIKGIISTIAPPAICTVSKAGNVRVAYTHHRLIDRVIETGQREQQRADESRQHRHTQGD